MSHFNVFATLPKEDVLENGLGQALDSRVLKYQELGAPDAEKEQVPDEWIEYRIWDSDGDIEPGVPHDRDKSIIKIPDRDLLERAGLAEHPKCHAHNTKGHWDWFSIGGRWSPAFRLHSTREEANAALGEGSIMGGSRDPDSNQADVAYKKDIDFEAMMDDAEERACERTRVVQEAVQSVGGSRDAPLEMFNDSSDFWEQPRIQAAKSATEEFMPIAGDVYLMAEDPKRYVQNSRKRAIAPYGFLHEDGTWEAKGDMGWWGMSNDHCAQYEWNKRAAEIIKSKPSDTVFISIDFHV